MKTLTVQIVGIALAVTYLSCSDIQARPVADWDYDHLVGYADLVVVATVVSSKRVRFDFDAVEPWTSWLQAPEGPKMRALLVAEVTTFRVKASLKGNAGGSTIDVFHFSLTGPLPRSLEGTPRLFKKGLAMGIVSGDVRSTRERGTENYLLFLKQRKDGLFDPVTGQVDSAYSVKQIRNLVPP